MKRFLFLDIDGVLNSTSWLVSQARKDMRAVALGVGTPRWERKWEIDPRNVRHLNAVLTAVPDLSVVVSSSWRKGMTVPQLRRFLASVGLPAARILDKTGEDESRLRYKEIRHWLANGVSGPYCFAAVDDDTFDMTPLGSAFFHVDREKGLTRAHARALVAYFRGLDIVKKAS